MLIADFATREGVRAYAPWEEQPAIPEQIPTGPLLLQFLSLKAEQNKVPEIGDYYQVRPRSQQVKLPVCYEYNLDDSSPNNCFAPFHELKPKQIVGPVLCVDTWKRGPWAGIAIMVASSHKSHVDESAWVDVTCNNHALTYQERTKGQLCLSHKM